MKATELMIGDWYYDTDPQKNRKFHQLQFAEAYGDPTYELKIEPIPLIAEILEKNGWINKEEKGWMQKGNFGDSPLMLWYIKDTGKFNPHFAHELEMSDLSKDGGFRIKVQCNYVHELQHALRLCGLDDLADNFVIN